CQQYLRAPFTF
nr:immunoglobulin light chain junction region [Macaca mulatta]MOW72954.1 immunoglobulin light chain junction region [Macaca mulatta]MOW73191.1 immunoglobulin light chain junction region [Macaca mulatta]MOW73404.1 immunoglobulin light chain junction region [Macaca mulatta]MOW73424.1 immunoglobulin light chain junction region [Macaca mulatta]